MEDLTVIFLTPNKVPKKWAEYQKSVLMEAIGDTDLITISKEPMDWGLNIIQTDYGLVNLFKQFLRGARLAKTSYVAIAEDDTLYTREHFMHRPPMDKIAYDLNRWIIFTWGKPFYFHKPSIANAGMIAPRELLIEALEERFEKYGDNMPAGLLKEVGNNRYERMYGVREIPVEEFYSEDSFVCFNHQYSIDDLQVRKRKRPWPVKAYDIPVWGKASELVNKFN